MPMHRQHQPVTPRVRVTPVGATQAFYAGPPPANDNIQSSQDFVPEEPEGISPVMLVPIGGILVCAVALFLLV